MSKVDIDIDAACAEAAAVATGAVTRPLGAEVLRTSLPEDDTPKPTAEGGLQKRGRGNHKCELRMQDVSATTAEGTQADLGVALRQEGTDAVYRPAVIHNTNVPNARVCRVPYHGPHPQALRTAQCELVTVIVDPEPYTFPGLSMPDKYLTPAQRIDHQKKHLELQKLMKEHKTLYAGCSPMSASDLAALIGPQCAMTLTGSVRLAMSFGCCLIQQGATGVPVFVADAPPHVIRALQAATTAYDVETAAAQEQLEESILAGTDGGASKALQAAHAAIAAGESEPHHYVSLGTKEQGEVRIMRLKRRELLQRRAAIGPNAGGRTEVDVVLESRSDSAQYACRCVVIDGGAACERIELIAGQPRERSAHILPAALYGITHTVPVNFTAEGQTMPPGLDIAAAVACRAAERVAVGKALDMDSDEPKFMATAATVTVFEPAQLFRLPASQLEGFDHDDDFVEDKSKATAAAAAAAAKEEEKKTEKPSNADDDEAEGEVDAAEKKKPEVSSGAQAVQQKSAGVAIPKFCRLIKGTASHWWGRQSGEMETKPRLMRNVIRFEVDVDRELVAYAAEGFLQLATKVADAQQTELEK